MDNGIYLPHEIEELTRGRKYTLDDIGMSGSKILLYDDMVLKIAGDDYDDAAETVGVMRWLEGRLPVPKVLCFTREGDRNYLLMSRIKGEMCCSGYMLAHPEELCEMAAKALLMVQSADTAGCPRERDIDFELEDAARRVRDGLVDMEDWEKDTIKEFKDPEHLLAWLHKNRPLYEPCLSHGDFCLPNIFVRGREVSGFIDLGYTATGDRWKDIALLYRSLMHNFDGTYGGKVYPGFDPDMLFEKLGIEPDMEKIRWFILLDELF